MVFLAGLVAVAVLVFGLADVTAEEEHFGHHPLTHAMLAGICGAFLTGDIFNMYVWFEVMLIASFGLLVVGGGRDELDGAMKYVGLNLIATVAFLSGVGLLYGATGALNMADLHGRLAGRAMRDADHRLGGVPDLRLRLQGGALPGVLLAAGLLPHPVLHHLGALRGAADQGRGLRADPGLHPGLSGARGPRSRRCCSRARCSAWSSARSGRWRWTGTRRVLGFSIISSIGYMILGLAVATPLALVGAVFYLFQDVVVKANLFLGAGAARRLTGSELFAPLGRPLARAAVVLAALPDPGAVARRRPALLRLLGQAPARQGDPRRRPLRARPSRCSRSACSRSSRWRGSGRRCSGRRIPTATTPCTGRLPAAMLAPLVALTALVVWVGVERRALRRRRDGGRRRHRRPRPPTSPPCSEGAP